jgi:hypothetical protein
MPVKTIPSQAMNIGGYPAAFNDGFQLINLFHGSALGWQSSVDGSQIDANYLDSKGWVKSLPNLGPDDYVLTNTLYTQELPKGKYILEWKGNGEILPWQNYKVLGPNKIEIDYEANYTKGDDGFTLRLLQSDPNDYVRDIKFYDAKYADLFAMGESFNPAWFQKIEDFKILRTHGMQETNFTTIKDFTNDVVSKDQAFWGETGQPVPLEALVEISNQAESDLWITIPHLATDDYMRKAAQYVKANLDKNLKVYVEYSNEYWTKGFFQNQYFIDKGKELFGDAPFANGQAYGARLSEMTKIFKQVFAGEQDRLVPTLTLNHDMFNTGEALTVLNTPDWVKKGGTSPLKAGIEFVATDGYFGWFNSEKFFDDIVDGFITKGPKQFDAAKDYLINEIKTDLIPAWKKGKALAEKNGLTFGVYEGGALLINGGFDQDPKTIDDKYTDFNKALQLSPQMRDVYEYALAEWSKIGDTPFAWFADVGRASTQGDYGLWNGADYRPEPRTNAIVDANKNPLPQDKDTRPASTFDNGLYDAGTMGADKIVGRSLDDRLYGLAGNDTLSGLKGNDRLVGGTGIDSLSGGDGNDQLIGGLGADTMSGGAGFDYASYQISNTGIVASLANSKSNTGEAAGDRYSLIEGLTGSAFEDKLTGDSARNIIKGMAGTDDLNGEAGKDSLYGGKGNDRLNGGAGDDSLIGGSGRDIFFFGPGKDAVLDWSEEDSLVIATKSGAFGDPFPVKINQSGKDTLLTYAKGEEVWSLTLKNTKASTITIADDFLFS